MEEKTEELVVFSLQSQNVLIIREQFHRFRDGMNDSNIKMQDNNPLDQSLDAEEFPSIMSNGWHLDEDSSSHFGVNAESLNSFGAKKRKLSLDSDPGRSSKKFSKIEATLLGEGKHGIVDGRWTCGECGKSLSSAVGLDQHLSTVHGAYQFPCEICNLMFKRRDHVRNHIKRVHDCRKNCSKCGASFVGRDAYAEHMKSVHKLKVTYRATNRPVNEDKVNRINGGFSTEPWKSSGNITFFFLINPKYFGKVLVLS